MRILGWRRNMRAMEIRWRCPPEKFRAQYEEEIKRKAVWYYCPQALSEYKIPTLDIAMLQGVLQEMAPPGDMGSHYADVLFQGPQPTTVQFPEPQAFRHYLQCLRSQVEAARARILFGQRCHRKCERHHE